MQQSFTLVGTLVLVALLLSACAAQTAPAGGEPTRDEARELVAKGDAPLDICDIWDWYGDGICDDFCVEPDPDCAVPECTEDFHCPQPLCAVGFNCPSNVCVDGECVLDDPNDACPPGQRECGGCPTATGVLCVDRGDPCPLLACPPPPDCGGIAGLTCPTGMYCEYSDNSCGAGDRMGICEPIPDAWLDIYAPVCGCDGVTYGNEGEAYGSGVDINHHGACEPVQPEPCYVGGCSGQLCGPQPGLISTCEWRPEYACYHRHGVCERQVTGECGWTPTPALNACLMTPRS